MNEKRHSILFPWFPHLYVISLFSWVFYPRSTAREDVRWLNPTFDISFYYLILWILNSYTYQFVLCNFMSEPINVLSLLLGFFLLVVFFENILNRNKLIDLRSIKILCLWYRILHQCRYFRKLIFHNSLGNF